MKTALIPPIPHLNEARGRDYHLLLSHLCRYQPYREFYTSEREEGSFLIIDNSAHENVSGEGARKLCELAREYRAQEIVLPDFLFNADQTVNLTETALTYIKENEDLGTIISFMMVPQGESPFAWRRCLYHLIEIFFKHDFGYGKKYSLTIGLSKDYEMWDGGLLQLLDNYLIPLTEEIEAEIHLLGWGRDLWALAEIARIFGPRIRSVDSAKPFVYGISGVALDPVLDAPIYPKRPNDYFDRILTENQLGISRSNIQVFDDLTRGPKRRSFENIRPLPYIEV